MRKTILGLLVMALFSGVCFAKEKDKELWENLQKVKKGQKLQIRQDGSIVTEGKFQSASDDELTVEVKKQPVVIKRTAIQRVVLKKSKLGPIMIGVGAGAAIGLVTLASSDSDSIYGAVLAIPILAGSGAASGALLSSSPVIYERR